MNELQVLTDRLDALDRQNRHLKRLLVAIAVLGAAAVGVGAQVAQTTVTAERFVLVDAQDHPRGTFELGPPLPLGTRHPVLTFLDAAGKPRLRVGLGARGAMMEIVDENGKVKDYLAPMGARPLTQ